MKLKRLLEEIAPACSADIADIDIGAVVSDSRRVKAGDCFVAVRGAKTEGFAYIGEALARGAAFVVAERAVAGVPHLVVADARQALAHLCSARHGHPERSLELIGITGTNGKSSTAEMLYHILRHAGISCGMIGTVSTACNGEVIDVRAADPLANMTTPEPEELYAVLSAMKEKGARTVVMEVTSHALVQERVAPLRFKRALFTNLSRDHLDFHGDMAAYYGAKKKLFSQCETAVISTRSAYGQLLSSEIGVPQITAGAHNVEVLERRGLEGTVCRLTYGNQPIVFALRVPGEAFVENASLAALTALSLGVTETAVTEALNSFRGVRGRMERVDENGDIAVFIDYAHTPDALERVLCDIKSQRASKAQTVLVFGCGGDRDRGKRKEMGQIATRLADLTVLTSDNSRGEDPQCILNDILKGIDKEKAFTVIPDRAEAIAYAIRTARAGDVVLLAGKGHECYELCAGQKKPFYEREIAQMALQARGEANGDAR